MAIPIKGSRRIQVNGNDYLWYIRRKGTSCQLDYGNGCLHVAVSMADRQGAILVIETDKPHPDDYVSRRPVVPITPADIREWIIAALALGWQPAQPGKPFYSVMDDGALVLRGL